jgi:hypothetical protein
LEMPHEEYFVFWESAVWGKYAASDYADQLDVFGFRGVARNIFSTKFPMSDPNSGRWGHRSRRDRIRALGKG